MSYNYTLKYRTFDQLLDDVLVDFKNYSLEGLVEPQQLIKVAKRVSYDLGLRILMTKQAVLEVEKGRVRLPDDFYTLNYALMCDEVTITSILPQGTHTAEIPYVPYQTVSAEVIDTCAAPVVNCGTCQRVTPCGCSTQPTSCTTCGGSTSGSITTTTSTTSTTNTCCWTIANIGRKYNSVSIVINGVTYTITSPASPGAILSYFNSLGLGIFSVSTINENAVVCATGPDVYGLLSLVEGIETRVYTPVCNSETQTTTDTVTIESCSCTPVGATCTKPRVIVNCKGEEYEIVQYVNTVSETYKRSWPIRIVANPESVDCNCPNIFVKSADHAWIQNGWLHTSFTCGKVYINYQGMLEDDDGNLLVPDHDLLNEYYEYALKQRILENLIMDDEPVGQKLQLVEARLRAARNNALSVVNTPNFAEMKQVWELNRKAMYQRYYNMFKSYR